MGKLINKRCQECGLTAREHGLFMWAIHQALWKQVKMQRRMRRLKLA